MIAPACKATHSASCSDFSTLLELDLQPQQAQRSAKTVCPKQKPTYASNLVVGRPLAEFQIMQHNSSQRPQRRYATARICACTTNKTNTHTYKTNLPTSSFRTQSCRPSASSQLLARVGAGQLELLALISISDRISAKPIDGRARASGQPAKIHISSRAKQRIAQQQAIG